MRSSYKILSALYRLINVPEVTNALTGKVYIGNPTATAQSEDIGLNVLNNPNGYLQTGYCNLNIYVPMIGTRHNLARLEQLTDIIIPLVDDSRIETEVGTFHFQIDDEKGPFKDEDRDGMSYQNLRLEFQTL